MDRHTRLARRHTIIRALRDTLDGMGFLEIQAPVLVRGTCPDAHLESFSLGGGLYLTTSTEYHLKRLFSEGVPQAYTLGPNFRKGDVGERHNPEFTMLEWGRLGATMAEIERDAEMLVRGAASAVGVPLAGFTRVSVREAFERHLGVAVDAAFSAESVRDAVTTLGGPAAEWAHDPAALLSWLLDAVQPHLGANGPEFLVDWPAGMTSSSVDGARAELFWRGLELSDGFPFLTDAAAQRAAFEAHLGARRKHGLEEVAIDQRYLEALEAGLPAGAGMAMGVDRLVMALLGVGRIGDVQAFGWREL